VSAAGATILVVDDEPVVLDTVQDGLTAHGYQVLRASGGDEALQVAQAHQGAIALALVDVVMPGVSGPEIAQRLHESRPDLKILFMSGFSTEVVVVHGLSAGGPLLVKPFSLDSLARKVSEILDYRSPFSRPPQSPR
jgi:DNA-binding response OmpR family regulator